MGCVDGSQEERIATGMSADIRSKWSSKLKFYRASRFTKVLSSCVRTACFTGP